MTATTFDFKQQLSKGAGGEDDVLKFFAGHGWAIEKTTMTNGQRNGIDARMTRQGHAPIALEIKTDERSWKTGNAFVETISVDTQNKAGWAYTSKADWLAYYLPQGLYFYLVRMSWLRSQLPLWQQQCRTVKVKNRGYCTHGLVVPLTAFEQEALDCADLPNDQVNCRVINL